MIDVMADKTRDSSNESLLDILGEDSLISIRTNQKKSTDKRDTRSSGDPIEENQVYKNMLDKLTSLGPLNIVDLNDFLVKSKIDFDNMYYSRATCKLLMTDFKPIKVLGKGAFSRVILAKSNIDESLCAIKCIEKKGIVDKHYIKYVSSEKRILQSINFPFVIYLKFFFADVKYVYFVMPYIPGGDFHFFLRKHKSLTEDKAKFYVGQLILAVEYLHYLELIHRDIKPENIIIDALGYLKLADFGQCTRNYGTDRTWTITGTPEYMAPEVIKGKGYNETVDWWSLGVVTYEICAGRRPFSGQDMNQVFKKVLSRRYEIPKSFSTNLNKFLQFLMISPGEIKRSRIKPNLPNSESVKEQSWLKGTDWMALLNRTVAAPYLPDIPDTTDTPG